MRFIFVAVLLASLHPAVTYAADLKVVIDGVRSNKGTVMVALFSNASAFDADVQFAGAFVTAKAGRVVVAFPELDSGNYAVSTFHDENSNGELDTNFLGVPTEGFGFSSDAMGLIGSPDFEAASVVVEDTDLTITLKLSY